MWKRKKPAEEVQWICSTRKMRERRTSPTDPASSSPGSFYVTAQWSSFASSPTLSTQHLTHTHTHKPQRTQTHDIYFLCNLHSRAVDNNFVFLSRDVIACMGSPHFHWVWNSLYVLGLLSTVWTLYFSSLHFSCQF